jgi:hypothetical protein
MRHPLGTASIVAIALLAAGPALAQIDLAGEWAGTFHEDLPHRGGMRLADYTGLPLNEAGWRKGHSWDEAARSTRERQCIPHVGTYAMRGPATIRFQKVIDPVTGQMEAYSLHGSYGRPRTIWMDGRPHPSDLAPHSWTGFSTGRWERNTLVVTTTHIKTGWLQRNGAPTSDLATMSEHSPAGASDAREHREGLVFLDEPLSDDELVLSPSATPRLGQLRPGQIIDELGGRPRAGATLSLVTARVESSRSTRRAADTRWRSHHLPEPDPPQQAPDPTSPAWMERRARRGRPRGQGRPPTRSASAVQGDVYLSPSGSCIAAGGRHPARGYGGGGPGRAGAAAIGSSHSRFDSS